MPQVPGVNIMQITMGKLREVIAGSMRGSRRFENNPSIQRYGVNIRPNSGSHLDEIEEQDDDESQSEDSNRCAIVIVKDGKGNVLSTSRGVGSNQWGFPGGHVRVDETFKQGAKRELEEETGITVSKLQFVYKAMSGQHPTACFIAIGATGNPRGSDEGEVRWVRPEFLLDPKNSPFAAYTYAALAAAGML